MPFYRVKYDGYMEQEFNSEQEAREAFLEVIQDNADEESYTVEEWDEEKQEWI